MARPQTLVELFCRAVSKGGQNVALRLPVQGKFEALQWSDFAQEVRRLAAGLRRIGLEPGDRVAQVSPNRYEWLLVDLAVHLARGVHVAIHASLSGQQVAHQIADSEARIVLLAGAEQASRLATGITLPAGVQFFSFDPLEQTVAGQDVLPFGELFAGIGHELTSSTEQEALQQTKPADLATILYTSGTTGEAKGVMLSHANLTINAVSSCDTFGLHGEELALSWLPWSHIFARTCDLYTWLHAGYELAVAESREKIIANCGALRPTRMTGVPYFYEKVYRHLTDANLIGPAEPGGPTHLQKILGGRIKACISGGAALPNHVAEFFASQGVPLLQGYGLTETSPVISLSTSHHNKPGSVGRLLNGVEVRIADDGEILTRGPHVMLGYWKRPADTAEIIRDGWLHTGDLGQLDADGYLSITGRKKELIVTAGGKNVAPVYLESLLVEDPLIAQAMIIGDGKKYLTALIVPNSDALRSEIAARGIPIASPAEALGHPEVLALYRQRIDIRLAGVADCEQIARFALLPRGFAVETDELTPTLKLRRKIVHEHFAAEIDALYRD